MKRTLSRYPLTAFFAMAFLFSWTSVLPLILNPELPVEPFQILGAFAGPTLSAIILTKLLEGRNGIRLFFKRYTQWRVGAVWWLLAIFGILLALNTVASLVVGLSVWSELLGGLSVILPTYLVTLVVGVILGPLWEEPGWRGFALPRLQDRSGPVLGTLILGALWALWHLPGYLGGWMTVGLVPLLLSSLAFSVLATWVYNNTHGSILLMIILHSSSNAAISIGTEVLPPDLSGTMHSFVFDGWIPAITYSIIASVVLIATRGTLSYEKTPEKRLTVHAADGE